MKLAGGFGMVGREARAGGEGRLPCRANRAQVSGWRWGGAMDCRQYFAITLRAESRSEMRQRAARAVRVVKLLALSTAIEMAIRLLFA
jgi:hypothetical protein